MKTNYLILASIFITVITIGAMFYAFVSTPASIRGETIRVVVTIVPQAEFVEKVGGEKVSVTILVPLGASPHTHEPKPSQMKEIAQADIYAKVGSPIEFELTWIDKIIEANPNMLLIDCSQGIDLIDITVVREHENENEQYDQAEHKHELKGKDPHIWLSPRNAMIMVENIYAGLVEIDPHNKDYYKRNKDAYIQDLKDLDNKLIKTFSGLTTKKFMVYHPSWGYLANDYDLEMIPIEEEGKDPTPEGLTHLIDQAKKHDIRVIFATPEFETKTAETVANELGGSVVLISPLAKNYIDNLSKISEEITKGLK